MASQATYANSRLLSQQSYSYDNYGNVISSTARKTDSENVTMNFAYGPEYGHAYLTAKSIVNRDADGNESVIDLRYAYDLASGNKTSESDGNGNVTAFKYDLLNRLVEKTNPDQTTQHYEYDDAGNIAYFTDENKDRTIYHFDSLGKLTRVRDNQQNIDLVNLKYDDQYNLLQKIDPNGNCIEYSYDQFNRLLKINHRDSRGKKLAETGVQYHEAIQDRSGTCKRLPSAKKQARAKKTWWSTTTMMPGNNW